MTDKKNILITGAKGQLGKCIHKVVKDLYVETYDDSYIFTDIDELDICNKQAISDFCNAHNIDIIVNCAAYTNVEAAEDDVKNVYNVNALAPKYLAEVMSERNGTLIHISTDYVFDGCSNVPYVEGYEPNPINIYGINKLFGEKNIQRIENLSYLIFRTSWLYSRYNKNFALTMLDKFSKTNNTDEVVKVVADQYGTPTNAMDLATAIVTIITERKYVGNSGLYHYSNEGICSWYDFAYAIYMTTVFDKVKIVPVKTCDFVTKAMRPEFSVLDKTKFKKTFGIEIPQWNYSLNNNF